jgi:hypothetical protein
MSLDTTIHGLAGELRARATELRLAAGRLLKAAETVDWSDRAAAAMRRRAAVGAGDLEEVARRHDVAASALDHHAAAVGAVLGVVSHPVESAVHAVEGLAHRWGW